MASAERVANLSVAAVCRVLCADDAASGDIFMEQVKQAVSHRTHTSEGRTIPTDLLSHTTLLSVHITCRARPCPELSTRGNCMLPHNR